MKKKIIIVVLTMLVLLCSVGIAASASGDVAVTAKINSVQLYLSDLVYIRFNVGYGGVDLKADDYGIILWMEKPENEEYTYENAAEKIANQKEGDPTVVTILDGKTSADYAGNDADGNAVTGKTYTTRGLAAKEWADMVYACAYVKDGDRYVYSDILPYSVTAYAARTIRNENATDSMKEMLRQMMIYGAAAQQNFDYNTDHLATEILPENHKNHVGRGWVVKAATCTENGEKTQQCIFCNEKMENEEIPAIGHKLGKLNVDDPTCTEAGVAYRVCLNCNEHIEVETVTKPATGHNFGKWITDKEATCTEEGSKHRVCTQCGESETETIAAKGHKKGTEWKIQKPTCTEDGYSYIPCTVCDAPMEIKDIGSGTATGHNWNAWSVTKPAACEEAGEKTRTCKNCTEKETESIPATGHSSGNWITDKEATCTEEGSRYKKCTVCGKEVVREVVAAKGHQKGTEWKIQKPTCTEDGYSYIPCIACDAPMEIKDIGAGAATGHDWNAWSVTKPAACEETGEKTRTCKNCTEKETESIPATGHSLGKWVIDKDATCTEEGSMHRECSCGKVHEDAVIAAKGHTPGGDLYVKQPTCTEKGYVYQICTKCGETDFDSISTWFDAKGHAYGSDGVCTVCHNRKASEGLEYRLSDDGESYIVVGRGSCKAVNIVIPETYEGKPVTGIAELAFVWCSDLESITIPKSVTSIGEQAFHGCTKLAVVEFGGTAAEWNSIADDSGIDQNIPVSCKEEVAA